MNKEVNDLDYIEKRNSYESSIQSECERCNNLVVNSRMIDILLHPFSSYKVRRAYRNLTVVSGTFNMMNSIIKSRKIMASNSFYSHLFDKETGELINIDNEEYTKMIEDVNSMKEQMSAYMQSFSIDKVMTMPERKLIKANATFFAKRK